MTLHAAARRRRRATARPSASSRARPAPRPSYGDPLEAALAWQRGGRRVDAPGRPGRRVRPRLQRATLLAEVVGRLDVKVELSGGIRDDASLAAALATGCARVNIGTAALEDPRVVRPGRRRVRRPGRGRPGRARHARWRPAAGPATAATCTRCWPASTRPRAAPATSSPTSPRTARCTGPNLELLREVCAAHRPAGRRLRRRVHPGRPARLAALEPLGVEGVDRRQGAVREGVHPGRGPGGGGRVSDVRRVERYRSGGPWEETFGYSRAVARRRPWSWSSGLHVHWSTGDGRTRATPYEQAGQRLQHRVRRRWTGARPRPRTTWSAPACTSPTPGDVDAVGRAHRRAVRRRPARPRP